jgi:hypothetical protein
MVLVLKSDGTGHALYDEKIDLNTLGPLHIERATHIEFDEESQYWRVRDRNGLNLFNAPSRQACLDWEKKHFSDPVRLLQHARST